MINTLEKIDSPSDAKEDRKIMKRFEDDYERMEDKWGKLHEKHRNEIKFVWFNEQWSEGVKNSRAASQAFDGSPIPARPCNVFNIIKPFIIKVSNGVKKMKPTLKVSPVDGEADKVLAQVRRGIIQSIERNTGAIPARTNATTDAISAGYGFYRFVNEYSDPMSMHQDIKYKSINDATNVYWDENSVEPDGSDCKKVILHESYSKEAFKREFGIDWEEVWKSSLLTINKAWGSKDEPYVSEYWYIEEKPEILVSIKPEFRPIIGGKPTAFYKDVKKMAEQQGIPPEMMVEIGPDGQYVKRNSHSRVVTFCKMAGKQVLKKEIWPGYWIPIFKVNGRLKVCGSDVQMNGLGHDARPSQESYNYARNNQLERQGLATKATTYVPVGSIPKTSKHKWATKNTRNWDSLEYNLYNEQGQLLKEPRDSTTTQIDPAMAQEVSFAGSEVMSTMGLYGAFIGDTTGEKSGRAIEAGAAESDDTVFDFAYNLSLTISHEARVLNEVLPKIYSTERQIRMVGEDDKEKVVWINKKAKDEEGQEYYYDMKQGKFDLAYSMGPSDATKRLETREGFESIMRAMPEFAFAISDYYVREQDFRKSDEAADRLTRAIDMKYPGLIQKDDKEPPPELVQAQQVIDQMHAQLQAVSAEAETIKADKRIEARKVEIDQFNAETKRIDTIMKSDDADDKNEIELLKTDMQAKIELLKESNLMDKNERDAQLKELQTRVNTVSQSIENTGNQTAQA